MPFLTLINVHLPAVNLKDARPRLFGRVRQLDLAIQPSGSQQSGVQNVGPIGRGNYLFGSK